MEEIEDMGRHYDMAGYMRHRRTQEDFRARSCKTSREARGRAEKVSTGEYAVYHIISGYGILPPAEGDGIVWEGQVHEVVYVSKKNYRTIGTREKYWKVWVRTEPTGDTPDDRHYIGIIKP